jgi:hypothetical protein
VFLSVYIVITCKSSPALQNKKWKKKIAWDQGCAFSILQCSETGNHPQEDLAKYGYILDMKVNFLKKNPCIFWLPAGTCSKNLEN